MIQNGFFNQINGKVFYKRPRYLQYGSNNNNNYYLSNQESPSPYYLDDYSNDRKSLHRKLKYENRNPNYHLNWRQVPYYSRKYHQKNKKFYVKERWKLRDKQNWRKTKERKEWMKGLNEEEINWNYRKTQQQQEIRKHDQVYNPYWTDYDYYDYGYGYRYNPYFYYG